MTTITATAEIAPTLSGLVVTDAEMGVGVNIKWTIPSTATNLFGVEIWRSPNNNRANATLVATVVGNTFFYPCVIGVPNYFWIRGVTVYGKSNGPWYPVSQTGGVFGKALDFESIPTNPYNVTYTGDNTWQKVATVSLFNNTTRLMAPDITFNAMQNYGALASDTQFKYQYSDIAMTNYTLQREYATFVDKVPNVTLLHSLFLLYPNTAKDVHVFWRGANSNVTLTFAQITARWNANSQFNL